MDDEEDENDDMYIYGNMLTDEGEKWKFPNSKVKIKGQVPNVKSGEVLCCTFSIAK